MTKKLLIVEDSVAAQTLYRELLKDLDVDIRCAADGREAYKLALSASFDLVLTDVSMPKMSGIELCRALQSAQSTRDVPVVIVSTFDSDVDAELGFEAGASAYLSKKDVGTLLVSTVRQVLWKYSNVRQRRVLIVEDSKSISRFIEIALTQNSFLVTTASNGKAALDILEDITPDLILSDLKMPEMDGYTLCRRLKSNPRRANIPIIAMSAGEDAGTVQRIIQYGAAAYLHKPFSMHQLVSLIDRILSDHFRIILQERERLDAESVALVQSIQSLVNALEARDPYTKGHSESVSAILTQLVTLSGAERSDVDLITIGGRLHDIGKIGIRDTVLLKPGKLTPAEFAHIQEHPRIGRKILEAIPSLQKILPIAYSHHERWDGNGYPEGLKGVNIPFWARLTSVADTFDALTSDRPYRAGLPLEKAFEIVRSARGTQLCPESVDIFFEYVQTEVFCARYPDNNNFSEDGSGNVTDS